MADGVFNDIKDALKGTTVLATPRVSRETIISVLQTHTDLILGLRKVCDIKSFYHSFFHFCS
jgi:hypothetical protein